MKRLLLLALTLMLLVATVPAISEEVSIDGLDTEALIELRNQINEKLGISDDMIGIGKYVAGVDIKPGRYDFLCTSAMGFSRGMCDVCIYSTEQNDADCVYDSGFIDVGTAVSFTLEKGNLLKISGGSGIIQEFSHSWAP